MKIIDLIQRKTTYSLEIFPPKKEMDEEKTQEAIQIMVALKPSFMSVTYGAMGKKNYKKSGKISKQIQDKGVLSLSHLTAVGKTKWEIDQMLEEWRKNNIQNILVLRGDDPVGEEITQSDFAYAKDLLSYIQEKNSFCLGAACYPEGHVDCMDEDLNDEYLLQKQECGASFLITQLFYDNHAFYRFRDRMTKKGLKIPILAGIMPMMSIKQVQRMIYTCGVGIPASIVRILHRYENAPDELLKAGIAFAVEQAEDLKQNGVDGIHFYTMNKPSVAMKMLSGVRR